MALKKRFIPYPCILVLALATVLICSRQALAEEESCPGSKALLEKYPAIQTNLEQNQFGIPLYLESTEKDNTLNVDLYGVLNYSFDRVSEALQSPNAWCEITSLLCNIKASICSKVSDQWQLTIYTGRKNYQPPKDAYKQNFDFRIAALGQGYVDIELTSKTGPFFTKDHRIKFEATQLDEHRTFIHFIYDYNCGFLARTALKTYYETIAHGKKGFSIIAVDKKGNPVYQDGVRGSEERNAVRSYLAIQTYMDTLDIADDQRFEEQLNHWYDLTERFPLQLHDLEKDEYLTEKRRERNNQIALQKILTIR
jgi:hypothetical protein